MSDLDKKIEEFFADHSSVNEGHYAKEDPVFFFFKKQDALTHAKEKNADNPEVVTFTREEQATQKADAPKLTVAEYKELKIKATAEYKELFGAEPNSTLSGVKIQELNDAKKAELANASN